MLLQAGGLVQRRGQRLALSAAGRRALYNEEPERVLAYLWEKWVALLDEFSRVHAIRGQGRRGANRAAGIANDEVIRLEFASHGRHERNPLGQLVS